jgi:hypothetical protein
VPEGLLDQQEVLDAQLGQHASRITSGPRRSRGGVALPSHLRALPSRKRGDPVRSAG